MSRKKSKPAPSLHREGAAPRANLPIQCPDSSLNSRLFRSYRQVQSCDSSLIADDFDGGDFIVGIGEAEDTEEAAAGCDDYSDIAVDENWASCASATGGFDAFFGPGSGAARFFRNAGSRGCIVEANCKIGIEDSDKTIEICGS
jgi:hypothetical protein